MALAGISPGLCPQLKSHPHGWSKAPGVEPSAALSQLSYTSCEVCAVFARHTPGWIRAGLPGMGGSAFQSGTQVEGSPPSLLCWIFLAVHHVTSGRPRPCISPPHMRCTADQTPVAMRRLAGMCRGLTVPRRYKIGDMPPSGVGAPNGFCHRDIGLENRYFTCKLPAPIVFLPPTSLLFYRLLYTFKLRFFFRFPPIQIRLNAQTLQNLSAYFLDKHNASPVE